MNSFGIGDDHISKMAKWWLKSNDFENWVFNGFLWICVSLNSSFLCEHLNFGVCTKNGTIEIFVNKTLFSSSADIHMELTAMSVVRACVSCVQTRNEWEEFIRKWCNWPAGVSVAHRQQLLLLLYRSHTISPFLIIWKITTFFELGKKCWRKISHTEI